VQSVLSVISSELLVVDSEDQYACQEQGTHKSLQMTTKICNVGSQQIMIIKQTYQTAKPK